MNNKMLMIAGVAVVVVIGGGLLLMQKPAAMPEKSEVMVGEEKSADAMVKEEPADAMKKEETGDAMMAKGEVKTFAVDGSPFKFSVTEMRVKKGDTVKVTFTNKEGFHDWKLDEFKVGTKQLSAGASETVTFVADKTGTFEYYCSVANHRAQGMVGKLIVE